MEFLDERTINFNRFVYPLFDSISLIHRISISRREILKNVTSRNTNREFASVDISAGINRRARIFLERKVGHNLRTLLKGSVSILDATIVREV